MAQRGPQKEKASSLLLQDARSVAFDALAGLTDAVQPGLQELLADGADKAGLYAQDRALAYALAQGVARNTRFLDKALAQLPGFENKEMEPPVRDILRLGAYQAFFLDRIPDHAIVYPLVELAKGRLSAGAAKFCNAALRRLLQHPAKEESERRQWAESLRPEERHSMPGWLARLVKRQYGPDRQEAVLRSLNAPLPIFGRPQPPDWSMEKTLQKMEEQGLEARPRPDLAPLCIELLSPLADFLRSPLFAEGGLYIQDASAQLVTHLALSVLPSGKAPQALDLCAAPGGKAIFLAGLLPEAAGLLALDVSPERLVRLRENVVRMGLENRIEIGLLESRESAGVSSALPQADLVLVDAPCSGLGTLRRHPEIRWRVRRADLTRLAQLQVEILERAAERVRCGGALVYGTCSLAEEENEGVLHAFLEGQQGNFVIEKSPTGLQMLDARLDEDGWLRLDPEKDTMDSARAVRLRREGSGGGV